MNIAIKHLIDLGSSNPAKLVYGCDIDPYSEPFAEQIIDIGGDRNNFKFDDFISSSISEKFDVVIGNPPYIKHDNVPHKLLETAQKLAKQMGFKSPKPNYWVYFILKSLSLLKSGGRLAMVVPLSIINARYASELRDILCGEFKSITVIPIKESVFEMTDERVAVIACDNYGGGPGKLDVSDVIGRINLADTLSTDSDNIENERHKIYAFVTNLLKERSFKRIDDLYEVKIGIVTGNKSYFILNDVDLCDSDISKVFLHPVVTKGEQMDLSSLFKYGDVSTYVLSIPKAYRIDGLFSDTNLDRYLRSAPKRVTDSYHCRNRNPWYHIPRIKIPDLIIKNINAEYCFMYPERRRATYTNNFITLFRLKDQYDVIHHSLFSFTSLFQLQIELHGISYGKSGIKLDPQHIKSLMIPETVKVNEKSLESLQAESLKGDALSMTKLADEIILRGIINLDDSQIDTIKKYRQYLYNIRKHY